MKSTASFVFYYYILLLNGIFGADVFSSLIESSPSTGGFVSNNRSSGKIKNRLISSPEFSNISEQNFQTNTDHSPENERRASLSEFHVASPLYHSKSEISESLATFSNLLMSPIMGRTTTILGELLFKYSLDGTRSECVNVGNGYSPLKLVNRLFGPQGAKNNSVGLLRYGFLYALFNEINNSIFKKLNFKYKLHPKLLIDPLKSKECIRFLNDANMQNEPFDILSINKEVFEIICEKVVRNNLFIEMQTWNNQITKIVDSIKKNLHSTLQNFEAKSKVTKVIALPEVPEIKVSGTDIKVRYLNIVKSIDAVKKKENPLFNSLIFTKKIAVKISAQYLPNGDELVQKCIEIMKYENPALMREIYQREKIKHICRVSMGN